MRIEAATEGQITIVLSMEEFGILQNALNEALENVAPSEATSRLGGTVEDVENILRTFSELGK